MLFHSSKIVAYLQKRTLELFSESEDEKEVLEFPDGNIQNLKVANEEEFKQQIVDFLVRTSFKKRKTLLVLGNNLLHETTFLFSEKEQMAEKAKKFFESVPFDQVDISKKTLTNDKDVFLIATNRNIYEVVMDAFNAVGWEIEKVVPVSPFSIRDKKADRDTILALLKDKNLLSTADFLQEDAFTEKLVAKEGDSAEKPESRPIKSGEEKKSENIKLAEATEKKKGKKMVFVIAGVLLLVLAVFAAYKVALPKATKSAGVIPVVTMAPTATPTPVIMLKKEEIKIQVQNGTGSYGQAKVAKDLLTPLDYSPIDTANAETADAVATTVLFSSKVAKEQRDEIVKALQKKFAEVTAKDGDTGNYDVVIITGKYL